MGYTGEGNILQPVDSSKRAVRSTSSEVLMWMPVSSSTWQASHAHQFKLLYHQPCHQAIPCSNTSKDETDHMQYEIKISDRRIEHCTSRAAVPTKSPSSSSSMPAGSSRIVRPTGTRAWWIRSGNTLDQNISTWKTGGYNLAERDTKQTTWPNTNQPIWICIIPYLQNS